MDNPDAVKTALTNAQNILFPVISGIGLIANAVVIVVITIWERYRANRTVANLFAVNLAVADFMFLAVLPLHMPAVKVEPITSEGICKLFEIIKFVNYRASILFLTMMSIDRYLAIVYTLKFRAYRSRSVSLKICILLWVLSIAAAVPVGVFAGIDTKGDSGHCKLMFPGFESQAISLDEFYGIDLNFTYYSDYSGDSSAISEEKICEFEEHKNSTSYKAWVYSSFVLFFLIPVAIILLSYASIIRATASRQIQASTKKSQHRVAKMVAVLVTGFVACWLPYQIWLLMTLPPGFKVPFATLCNILDTVFAVLAWSNSALNPILYSISSQRFRTKAIQCAKYLRYGYQRSMLMEQQTIQTKMTTLRQRHTSQPSSPMDKIQAQENVNPTFEQESQTKL